VVLYIFLKREIVLVHVGVVVLIYYCFIICRHLRRYHC